MTDLATDRFGLAAQTADLAARTESVRLEKSAIRLTAWRILPLLMLCYFVAYLDRVNLSFAALQMNKSLGLSSAQYGLGAGLFFLTYCVCEIPSNLLLYRLGATRWIARIMFTLGICAAGMAFVQGQTSFYVVRMALGAAEAGFYPGILFFLTLWFPAAYSGRILGLFIAAIPVSGIIGAPLSGQLLGLEGVLGLQGWQWLFIVEAAPAFILAPLVVARLQDTPAAANWLPEPERAWLIQRLESERAAVDRKRIFSILQTLANPRVLFLAAVYFSNVCLLNSITFFLPQIVKGFGLSNAQTGLVAAIPSLLALGALIYWGRRSDRRGERHGHAAAANFVGGAALLLSVLIHDPAARIAALAVAFACTLAFTAPFWSIPRTFLTGGAAAGGIGAISALGVLGGFLSPWMIGWIKDRTGDFRIGLGAIAVLAICLAAALFFRRPVAQTLENPS
jgi:MFS family permease